MTPADDLDSSCEQSLTPAPTVVLDTNAVLDWLLFADPRMAPLASAVTDGRLRWIATARMRDEFAHVLARGLAATRRADPAVLAAAWHRHCCERPTPLAMPVVTCTGTSTVDDEDAAPLSRFDRR